MNGVVDIAEQEPRFAAVRRAEHPTTDSNPTSSNNNKRAFKPRSQRKRKRPHASAENETTLANLNIQIVPLHSDQHQNDDDDKHTTWLRLIEPYPYTFSSFCKARWIGQTLLQVYTSEFQSYPGSYYRRAIEQGLIRVGGRIVPADYSVSGSDVLSHTVHRHEPAVQVGLSSPPFVTIVGETDDVLAVDKPGTLPVHPCGGYHQNSLIPLLERALNKNSDELDTDSKETTTLVKQQQQRLYTIHRLDRLTSGLVILAKRSEVARDWARAIQERDSCTKLYLARVKGRFPLNIHSNHGLPRFLDKGKLPVHGEWLPTACSDDKEGTMREKRTGREKETVKQVRQRNAYGYWMTVHSQGELLASTDVSIDEFAGTQHSVQDWLQALSPETCSEIESSTLAPLMWLNLACPVRIANHKDGVCESGTFEQLDDPQYLQSVKPAKTSFAVIAYDPDSDSTVVLCRPVTGRTHQIRIHLQHIGHPIANDPNYGGDLWYANAAGQQACQTAQEFLQEMDAVNQSSNHNTPLQSLVTTDVPATENEIERMAQKEPRKDAESLDQFLQRTCVWCARSRGQQEKRTKMEFLVRSAGIWLHALQYRIQVGNQEPVCFSTKQPAWARFE